MNFRNYFQYQIIGQCTHFRPVFDIWTKLNFCVRVCYTLAVKDSVFINCLIKEITRFRIFYIKIRCGSQVPLICCSCCNGTCIHQSNRRNLTILNLRTFTIREVSGRVTNTKRIVCRCISSSKARTAKRCFYNCTRLH